MKFCMIILNMQKAVISIVYHSTTGHTEQLAKFLHAALESPCANIHLINVDDKIDYWETLHHSDTIIFGSPTYMGSISARFKYFIEETGKFWYKQLWKNKLAAGFTNSSTTNGDKLNTLNSLFLFAAQHSMHWINLGVLPRFVNDEQTDGQNRMASYVGLMAQTNNSQKEVIPLHPGDELTAELFAKRILEVTLQFKI